jgi:O-antigen ligase
MGSVTAIQRAKLLLGGLSRFEAARFVSLVAVVLTLPFATHITSVCIMMLGACWLLENQFRDKLHRLKHNRFALFSISFYLLNAAGLLYTTDVARGTADLETKLSLIVLPLMLASTAPLGRQYVNWILGFFVAACTVAVAVCLGQAAFYYLSSGTTRYFFYHDLSLSIGMHAVYLALYLSFCLFILSDYLNRQWRRLRPGSRTLVLLLMSVMLITILLLSSKTIIISLVLFGDIFLITIFTARARKKLALLLLLLVNLTAILSILFIPFIRERFTDSIETNYSSIKKKEYNIILTGISLRTGIWTFSMDILTEQRSWLFGVGAGDTQGLLDEMYVRHELYIGVPGTPDRGYLGYNAHNQYVQFLLSLGLVGVAAFLVYLTVPVILAIKAHDYLLLALVLFFSVCCLTESMLDRQKGVVFYVLFSTLLLYQVGPAPTAHKK